MDQKNLRSMLAQSLVVGIAGHQASAEDLRLVGEHGLGGVILFARNLEHPPGAWDPRGIWELTNSLHQQARRAGRPPVFMMVDQEGGSVARLKGPFTHQPAARELGKPGGGPFVGAHAGRMGKELLAAGFNWNLAPVLDVDSDAGGVMASRSFGADADLVADLGFDYLRGLSGSGCLACVKHFPGLGRTTDDSHMTRPRVALSRRELDEKELVPFRKAMGAQPAGVMVCHAVYENLDPHRPASLSPLVIQDVLRGELGYGGLVVSDDLEMGALAAEMEPDSAAAAAYLAGCDLLLVCSRADMALSALDRLEGMARQGIIPVSRIEETARRIAALKRGMPLPPQSPQELERLLAEA